MGFKVTLTQIKTAIETGFSLQIWDLKFLNFGFSYNRFFRFSLQIWDLKDQNPVYFVVWLDVLASKYGI